MILSFPFYVGDWRDSSARIEFTTSEKLLYLELIIWCWKDGDLPTSEDALRTISGMSSREFRAAWKKVQSQFLLQDGRYHHHKVDEKRPGLESWREDRVQAGKKGGRATAIAAAKAQAIATAKRKLSLKPSSSSSSEETPLPPLGDGVRVSESPLVTRQRAWFTEFWDAVWLKVGKGGAQTKFRAKVKTEETFAAVMAGVKREAIIQSKKERQYQVHPKTWLSEDRWTDESNFSQQPVDDSPHYISSDDMFAWMAEKDERDRLKWEASQAKAGNA